jgi:hypothetical protein
MLGGAKYLKVEAETHRFAQSDRPYSAIDEALAEATNEGASVSF